MSFDTPTMILIGILWVIVGLWICFKSDWYYEGFGTEAEQVVWCCFGVVLAPLNLVWTIVRQYGINKWRN